MQNRYSDMVLRYRVFQTGRRTCPTTEPFVHCILKKSQHCSATAYSKIVGHCMINCISKTSPGFQRSRTEDISVIFQCQPSENGDIQLKRVLKAQQEIIMECKTSIIAETKNVIKHGHNYYSLPNEQDLNEDHYPYIPNKQECSLGVLQVQLLPK